MPDEQMKLVVRAYRSVFPGSKPSVTMGFYEAKGKEPEAFTTMVADSSTPSNIVVQGQGPTMREALVAVSGHLAKLMRQHQEKDLKDLDLRTQHSKLLQEKINEACLQLDPPATPQPDLPPSP